MEAKINSFLKQLENKFDIKVIWFIFKIFYLFVLFLSFNMFSSFLNYRHETISPLWPLFWVNSNNSQMAFIYIGLFVIFFSLCAFLKVKSLFFRTGTCIGLLELVAFTNSFGKINHNQHLLVLISFLAIFLPTSKNYSRVILAFFACQLMIMLTYTLSGFWKVENGFISIFNGQIGSFHPHAMAYQLAANLLETNTESLIGNFLIYHYWISWPFYLIGIYLEFFSVLIVFKPVLHKTWGFFLILFHITIYLSMKIPFSENIFLLGLFFVLSPLKQEKFNIQKVVTNLPLIDFVIARFIREQGK